MSRSLARENTRAFRNFTVDASVLVQIQANQQGPKKKMQGLPKDIPFRRLPVVLIADDYVPLTTSELNTIHQHLQVNIVNTAVARNPDSTIIESRGEDGSGEVESIQGDQKLEGSAHELDDSEGDNSEERDGDSLMEEVSPCAQKVVFSPGCTRYWLPETMKLSMSLKTLLILSYHRVGNKWLKLVMLNNGLKQRRKNSMHSWTTRPTNCQKLQSART